MASGRSSDPPDVTGYVRLANLEAACNALQAVIPDLEEVWLFGSRRHNTQSKRSDIDVLLRMRGGTQADLNEVMEIRRREPYIDCFSVAGGTATSLANASEIVAGTWEDLRGRVDALLVWASGRWVGEDDFRVHEVLARNNPVMTIAELGQLRDPLSRQFDASVLTTLQEEYEACIEVFQPAERSVDQSIAIVEGPDPHKPQLVRLACIGRMGPVEAAAATTRLLLESPSSVAILIGIAAGISGRINLGDIAVPMSVFGYESAKITADRLLPAPDQFNADRGWHARARALSGTFRPSEIALGISPRPEMPFLRLGNVETDVVMASGNKVVADAAAARDIAAHHRKTSAIEMEALGVAVAAEGLRARTPFLVVKAISDLGDDEKGESWRPFACRVAAEFTHQLIDAGQAAGSRASGHHQE